MTTPTSQSRVPAGVPTGGRFAVGQRDEAALTLDAPAAPAAPAPPVPATGLDLTAAAKVVNRYGADNDERERWLEQLQTVDGLAPGTSSSAHRRAFSFVEALRKAGYTVTEGPWGPRGGRRFHLTGYEGDRGVLMYEMKTHRSCHFDHDGGPCDCFDHLTDAQLADVKKLRLAGKKLANTYYPTDRLADVMQDYDTETIHTAMRVDTTVGYGRPSLRDLCEAIEASRL